MRNLSEKERDLLLLFAGRLAGSQRAQLLVDIDAARVSSSSEEKGRLSFALEEYLRPTYSGQQAYPVEARMLDADGEELSVALYADENGRLLELEFIRWANGQPIAPQWNTLQMWS